MRHRCTHWRSLAASVARTAQTSMWTHARAHEQRAYTQTCALTHTQCHARTHTHTHNPPHTLAHHIRYIGTRAHEVPRTNTASHARARAHATAHRIMRMHRILAHHTCTLAKYGSMTSTEKITAGGRNAGRGASLSRSYSRRRKPPSPRQWRRKLLQSGHNELTAVPGQRKQRPKNAGRKPCFARSRHCWHAPLYH